VKNKFFTRKFVPTAQSLQVEKVMVIKMRRMNNMVSPIEESLYIYGSLAITGGFLEAYTFATRGLFCNAQTGNLTLIAIELANKDFLKAVMYLMPVIVFAIGVAISTLAPVKINLGSRWKISWSTLCIFLEMAALFLMGMIPKNFNDLYTVLPISFITSLQYTSFKNFKGNAIATVMCTNNIRQTAIHISQGIREKDSARLKKALPYLFVITSFLIGAFLSVIFLQTFSLKAIWLCVLLLLPVFIRLLSMDLSFGCQKVLEGEGG
jgi:uncharacterized membrane protein YoaK (UPF0700 family)